MSLITSKSRLIEVISLFLDLLERRLVGRHHSSFSMRTLTNSRSMSGELVAVLRACSASRPGTGLKLEGWSCIMSYLAF
jgi:hypothetical protein